MNHGAAYCLLIVGGASALVSSALGAQFPTSRRPPPPVTATPAVRPGLATIDARPTGPALVGLAAAATGPTTVMVRWSAASGAAGYFVYRNSQQITPTPITDTVYLDRGVYPKTTVSYTVAAFYPATAAWSRSLSATVAATTPPGLPPASISARWTGPGSVTVSWPAAPGASGYLLLRNKRFVGAQPLRTTAYTDQGLPNGTYLYQVAAYYRAEGVGEVEGELTDLPAARAAAPIRGFADTHSHPFANFATGSLIFWGQAFGPIEEALGWCDPIHGLGGVADVVGNVARGAGHNVGGYKAGNPVQFDGWPTWNTLTHQQMYVDWIYRAYQGGLRLLVAHAVNNSSLCLAYLKTLSISNPSLSSDLGRCDDMRAVDLQLDAAKRMEAYIDAHSGGPGTGWFRIAYTPEQARQIIYSGRLAVVLGIEVDNLFGCSESRCDDATVDQKLERYYQFGVRHVIPIHLANNGFGGYANYDWKFWVNNVAVTGVPPDLESCTGEGYELGCNRQGLTPHGRHLISAMMSRGMIIDVDHMSRRSANEALAFTSGSPSQYPMIAGHTGLLGVSAPHTGLIPASVASKRSEAQKTDAQLSAIHTGGGMVSVILHQGAAGEISPYRTSWNRTVLNDCPESSKTWAQAYLYAVDHMGGWSAATVGIGSDQMLNPMVGPRFDPARCAGSSQQGRVQYPFTPLMPGAAPMDRSVTAGRTFDFNTEGLAHYGLLPDFIQDLQNVGLTPQDLEPLFRSAEGYIQMWERAQDIAAGLHVAAASSQ